MSKTLLDKWVEDAFNKGFIDAVEGKPWQPDHFISVLRESYNTGYDKGLKQKEAKNVEIR